MSHAKPWVVMKFGGTSVGDPSHWPTILNAILKCQAANERPFVVCSALSGVSNLLQALLNAADAGQPFEADLERFRERHLEFGAALGCDVEELVAQYCDKLVDRLQLDRVQRCQSVPASIRAQVMSVGELLSTLIAAEWLRGQGLTVGWKDARKILKAIPAHSGASELQSYLSANCDCRFDAQLQRDLEAEAADVVLTQGFIASDEQGATVLLGRGGSDTAASYLAAKVGACRLEIWTDVPGVFTANPRDVSAARLLYELSYDESETLAGLGAKVLHPPCIHPVRQAGIPLEIRWTAHPEIKGTIISKCLGEENQGIKAVSSRSSLSLISMERRAGWQPIGFMADVAACFKQHALSMDLLSSSPSMIQATLDLSAGTGVADKIPALLQDLDKVCKTSVQTNVASVSLVGQGIRSCMDQLGGIMEHVHERELLMVCHAANDLTFSLVLPREEAEALVRCLHAELFESTDLDSAFGPSWQTLCGDAVEEGELVAAAADA